MSWQHDGHVATHLNYALSCDEYNQLVLRSEGRCERCHSPVREPQIDHDHVIGSWAVRGLVCQTCNLTIDLIERGVRVPDPRTEAYFERSFHRMLSPDGRGVGTSQHRHTNRNYRPADDEYDPAKATFEAAGHNMNVAIRAFLRWINEDPGRVAHFAALMKAIDDETPKGRPKKKAPPAE